jgi:hypothetical protein
MARALVQAAGIVQVALGVHDEGEVLQAQRGLWMVTAQAGLADREGTVVMRAGRRQIPQVGQHGAEMVEATGDVRVIGAKLHLMDR